QHWELSSADSEQQPSSEIQRDVLRALPRRPLIHKIEAAHVSLPMARRVVFRPGIFLPCARLAVWITVTLTFFCGNALDSLLGRASVQRSAARFRRCLERAGASMVKVGQQLSVRADLLPYAYCIELGKLLDNVPPIATQKAISIIE